jgi:FlaG/FlaF family flagellin (archaellin)
MPQYRKPDWIKASIALLAMGAITLILFAVISSPFTDVLTQISDEAGNINMNMNEYFDVSNPSTDKTVTLETTPQSIKTVSVNDKRTKTDPIKDGDSYEYYWIQTSSYTITDDTLTVQSSAMTSNTTSIQVKYIKGNVSAEIDSFITMFQTVFGTVFALSMIGLIMWFFLGSHEEEHEQYVQERKRPPGGSEQW